MNECETSSRLSIPRNLPPCRRRLEEWVQEGGALPVKQRRSYDDPIDLFILEYRLLDGRAPRDKSDGVRKGGCVADELIRTRTVYPGTGGVDV